MPKERVAVYFDGFNLYHALCDLNTPYLKWVNLQRLSRLLVHSRTQDVVKVAYFSAFATYFQNTEHEGRIRRHEAYIRALEAKGVECHMGNFAKRDLCYKSRGYRATWKRREEKQTDVAIAVNAVRDACYNVYDRALIVSCDTDMLPLFRIIKADFPEKVLITVAPPGRTHHRDLLRLADDHLVIKRSQVEKALFGRQVIHDGQVVAYRPNSYRLP